MQSSIKNTRSMDSPCRHFITQWFLTLFWFLHPLTYPQNSRSPAYTTRPLVSNNSYTCWATNNAHGNKLLITFEITNAQNCLVVFGDLIIKKLPSVNNQYVILWGLFCNPFAISRNQWECQHRSQESQYYSVKCQDMALHNVKA